MKGLRYMREVFSLISDDIISQIIRPKQGVDFGPYKTALTIGIQFSLQLADTIGKTNFFLVSAFSKVITFIPIFEVVKVSGRHWGHFGQRKRKK